VKVSLSADGGDEQFCGYTRYVFIANRILKLANMPLKDLLVKILETIGVENLYSLYKTFRFVFPKYTNVRDKVAKLISTLKEKEPLKLYDTSLKYFLSDDLKNLIMVDFSLENQLFKLKPLEEKVNLSKVDPLTLFLYYDLKTYLPDDILVKVDRATMGVALEGRDPFLDHKILEWSSQLPIEFKYRNRKTKYLLRKILYKYLPKELIDRPKQGFSAPIYKWFKKELKILFKEFLNESKLKKDGLFNVSKVQQTLRDYLDNKRVTHNKLWILFIFQLWKESWFK